MNKFLLIAPAVLAMTLAACDNVGGGANVLTITSAVTSGNCTGESAGVGMQNGESCAITVNYNNVGGTGSVLSYTPESLPLSVTLNPTFNNTFAACKSKMNSNSSGTCDPIVITYTKMPLSTGTNFPLNFVITSGSVSATSNPVQITGE